MIGVDAVVIVAMDDEAAPFRSMASGRGPETQIGAAQHEILFLAGRTILLVRSGIGLVNAAAATSSALMRVKTKAVISAGSAGGLGIDIEVGNVVVASETSYSTADATDFGYALGQVPGMPARFTCDPTLAAAAAAAGTDSVPTRIGLVVSADAFVTARIVNDVRSRFPTALSTDMESTAINHIATAFDVSFVSVRGVSDLCGPAADSDHATHVDDASERSAAVVTALLATI